MTWAGRLRRRPRADVQGPAPVVEADAHRLAVGLAFAASDRDYLSLIHI